MMTGEKDNQEQELEQYDKKKFGEGIKFERIRRITGYLVGDVSRWNDGKRKELQDREKHQ